MSDTITREIQISADPQRVWDALADSTRFGTWFRVALDGPFAVGETTTGKMTYPGHEGVPWTSVTEIMEPPTRFAFRWPDLADGQSAGPDTHWLTVTFELRANDGGTLVTLTETGFDAVPEERRVSLLRDNAQGWEIQSANLKRHVEG